MTDILPIDREKLTDDAEPINKAKELKMIIEEEEEQSEEEAEEPTQDELFEKPKKKTKQIFKADTEGAEEVEKPKKKKRVLSEAQLANLAKAREKSMARRKDLKEARAMDAALKKDERMKQKDARLRKQEEGDELILMKARLKQEATAKGVWDEDRIEKLMMKTLDTYIDKRKKEKSIPKTTIPAPQAYPHLTPQQQPINPSYYNTQQQPAYHQHKNTQHTTQQTNDALSNLFGFGNNNY
mgnify:CR=1 FL=1|tara:strand:- start:3211 stop:3930 length:720 start_codon:yes stop_codon:yes gene_type:complete